ncbi:hypothetical protein IMY05_001G0145700 [Salix suchowensis]|nr:hypothetical protein IMY05_001G0145700 [Salix suchowensis]
MELAFSASSHYNIDELSGMNFELTPQALYISMCCIRDYSVKNHIIIFHTSWFGKGLSKRGAFFSSQELYREELDWSGKLVKKLICSLANQVTGE